MVQRTNDVGEVTSQTNQLCVLDHGMYYLENGEYKESKDLVESFPDGAIARYGAYQTIFSPELNVPAVFDIQTPDAKRIRGGVRVIQLTDMATGNSVVLGTVKNAVPGELIPPNQVIYRSAFDGLNADVLYVWKHNAVSQNIIIRENIAEFPPALVRATTRLEIVTELIEPPEVQIIGQVLKQDGKPDLVDDGLIQFGQMVAVPGLAFPVAGENSLNLTGPNVSNDKAVPVFKQWQRLDDGRTFVIESVAWGEIEPLLKDLRARADNVPKEKLKAAQARTWPDRVATATKAAPMQVASLPYKPTGYLVDLELLPYGSVSSKTFYSTTTYYIPNFYQVTASVTFQGGTVIKLGPSATLSLSGAFTSPTAGVATLTSRDDDTAGEKVINAGSPPYTSDGVVSAGDWSNAALSLYNGAASIKVQRFRVRYAGRGISDYSPYYTHTVQYCRMENCGFGVYAYYTTVNMTNNEVCNVATNGYASTGASVCENGTINECGPFLRVMSFAGLKQQETGTSVPDTMGAAGPNHFIELGNGGMAVYDKFTGLRIKTATLEEFSFLIISSPPAFANTYPTSGGVTDPRIIYDHLSQRWIASILDYSTRHVLLAISNGPDPIGNGGPTWVSDNWKKYLVPFGGLCHTDFDRLAVDGNGIYIGAEATTPCKPIVALPKAQFTNGTAQSIPTQFTNQAAVGAASRFPISVNFDPVTTDDPVWFLSVAGHEMYYNKLRWTQGFSAAPEWEFSSPGHILMIPPTEQFGNITAPQLGSAVRVSGQVGTLTTTVARKVDAIQYLWTCRQIEVNKDGLNLLQSSAVDRWAIEWFKIQTTPSVSIVATGRIYDTNAANPKFYYFPSLAVNKYGDMVIGFSGSSANEYASAYYTGRLNNGAMPANPIRYLAGKDSLDYPSPFFRWGDYSHTSLDPDGVTFWTIQEYAETRFLAAGSPNAIGTWIGSFAPF